MNIISNIDNNVVTAHVSGRIDSTNAVEFEKRMVEVDTSDELIIDIEHLEYISSAGLRVILKLRKKHSDLKIINASSEVYEIFDMTGFTDMLSIKRAYRTVSVDGCEVIGRGANGEVYRIDPDTVVKVYMNADSLSDIEHEREVARKALILGIPTAISYDVVKVGDHFASMFEMLNAKSFAKLLAANPDDVEKYAKMYVDLLKLIHSTEVAEGELPNQKETFDSWIPDVEEFFDVETYEKLKKLVNTVPYDNHMIHGDYHVKNIMLQNDEVILIDMDTLAVGHPVLEFASVYNAYKGFALLDHSIIKSFLGIEYEVADKLWYDTLKLYYETDDAEIISYREKQAMTVGLLRLLRRAKIKTGDATFADAAKIELIKLINELDTLV